MISIRRNTRIAGQHDGQGRSRSYAAYIADRPVPVDAVERLLLRFDWLMRRAFGRA